MIQAGSLCRDLGTLVTRNKKYVNRASPVSWDPSVVMPGIPVETFQRLLGGAANKPREKQNTGNTLIMLVLVLYIKMAAPDLPFSCNTGIKVTSAELASPVHVIRPLL